MKHQIPMGANLFSGRLLSKASRASESFKATHTSQKSKAKVAGIATATCLLSAALSATLSGTAYAENNAENGKVLYEKSKCQKCHGTEVFTREDRKVNSLKALETQVRMCDSQLSVNWFDEDISDVVAYLNQAFYKFDTQSNKAQKAQQTKETQ